MRARTVASWRFNLVMSERGVRMRRWSSIEWKDALRCFRSLLFSLSLFYSPGQHVGPAFEIQLCLRGFAAFGNFASFKNSELKLHAQKNFKVRRGFETRKKKQVILFKRGSAVSASLKIWFWLISGKMDCSKVVQAVQENLSRRDLENIQKGRLRLIVLDKDYLCRVTFGNFDFRPGFFLAVRNKNKLLLLIVWHFGAPKKLFKNCLIGLIILFVRNLSWEIWNFWHKNV